MAAASASHTAPPHNLANLLKSLTGRNECRLDCWNLFLVSYADIYLDSSYLDLSWDPWDVDLGVASYQEDPGLQVVRQEVRQEDHQDLQDLAASVPSF